METYRQIIEPFAYPIKDDNTGNQGKIFFGTRNNRKCIYCKKTPNEVPFKKEAHVIPASLGNRKLYNYNECDICNEKHFSIHENELANYLMLDRIFIGAKKRSGLPKYKPNPLGESSIQHIKDTDTVRMNINELEGKFEIINDVENKQFIYKINDPLPYSPYDICKVLTHMIWPFLSEEQRLKFSHISEWMRGEIEILPLYLDIASMPGNGLSHVILECWQSEKSDSNYPLMVRFTFGTKILSFYIPATSQVTEPPAINDDYPNIPEHLDENLEVGRFHIKGTGRMEREHLTFTMKYQSIDDVKILEEQQ
jgi:hypothetical protein